ncbi:hypothetical protein [Halorarum halophilum]
MVTQTRVDEVHVFAVAFDVNTISLNRG